MEEGCLARAPMDRLLVEEKNERELQQVPVKISKCGSTNIGRN